MPTQRQQRVGELLREDISRIIQRELSDPRLPSLISVTEVAVSPDLRQARVFVSVYGDAPTRDQAMAALEAAAGRIRGHLGRSLRLRYTPELEFVLDTSLERGAHILELLDQLGIEQGDEGQTGDHQEDREPDSH